MVQSAAYMSPPRWHIGHTSWFFEVLLYQYKPGYKVASEEYLYYFNSYYESLGERLDKNKRGTLSRPTVQSTLAYRRQIDAKVLGFFVEDTHPSQKRRTHAFVSHRNRT